MKKKLKQILFVIPIFLMMFITTDVKAADVCDNASILKTGLTIGTSKQISIANLRTGRFYEFSIDNKLALCLDPGKAMGNNLDYALQSNSYITDPGLLQAYQYAENNSNNTAKRLVAQIVAWVYGLYGRTDTAYLRDYVKSGLESYYRQYEPLKVSKALEHADIYLRELSQTTYSADLKLYIWRYKQTATGYQRLITKVGEGYIPCEPTDELDNCTIENIYNLAECNNKDKNYNEGGAYQQAVGNCKNEYTEGNYNISGKVNNHSINSSGYCKMYCVDNFQQYYPSHITKAAKVGRYIVWPNNNINNNSYKNLANLDTYPLYVTLARECHIYVNTEDLNADYSDAKSNMYTYRNYREDYLDNFACDTYEALKNEAYEEYEEAQAIADACTTQACFAGVNYVGRSCDSYVGDLTCSCSRSCGAEDAAAEEAYEEYEAANNDWGKCKNYGEAYQNALGVIQKYNNCINAELTNDLEVDFNYQVTYNDPTYKDETTFMLEPSNSVASLSSRLNISQIQENPLNVEVATLNNKAIEIQNQILKVSVTKYYDLKTGYYNYVNKDDNRSVHYKDNLKNYNTIGFSNMPISFKAEVGRNYRLNLKITDISNGTVFDSALLEQNYTCYYRVTDGGCECPEGSDYPGMNLDNEVVLYNYTCSEAQNRFCYDKLYCMKPDGTEIDITECRRNHNYDYCANQVGCVIPTTLECPPDATSDDGDSALRSCVYAGNKYEDCVGLCYVNLTCPDDPAGTTEMTQNFRDCVGTKMAQGLGLQAAKNACYQFCESESIRFIYRTISLTNPFPGYDASGRYPGANWNSDTIVKNVILKNRKKDSDEVYNKKPLYTFVLNSNNIKAIREYNREQKRKGGYTDFNLECKLSESDACVSSFIHNNTISGFVESKSTCGGKLTAETFYTCADKTNSMGNPVSG